MIIYFDGGLNDNSTNIPYKEKKVTITYGVLFHNNQQSPVEKNDKYELPLKYNPILKNSL